MSDSGKESEDENSELLVKRKAVHRRKTGNYEMLKEENSQAKRRKTSGQSQNQLSPSDFLAQSSQVHISSGQDIRQGTSQISKQEHMKKQNQSMVPTNIYKYRTRQNKLSSIAENSQSDSSMELDSVVPAMPQEMMISSTNIKNASNVVGA